MERSKRATLISHPDNGILYYSEGTWRNPGWAVRERSDGFRAIAREDAIRLFGDAVPRSPGEWAEVENTFRS